MRIIAVGPWQLEIIRWDEDDKFWINTGPYWFEFCIFGVVFYFGREGA
jgi:hypothetical protein